MRLSVTGAVLRAARSARLAPQYPNPTLGSWSIGKRWQSTQLASTNPSLAHEDELEEHPLRIRRVESSPPIATRFDRNLKEAENNTIVQDYGPYIGAKISGHTHNLDQTTNITPAILGFVDRNLYDVPNHPISITRKLIESVFQAPIYHNYTAQNPVVTTHENFDTLGFPENHPGRSRTDTYYVNFDHVLRTHTSAHQHAAFQHMVQNSEQGYTICADVYRRDSIDRSHFPVFHQMEGARVWQLEHDRPGSSRYQAQMKRKNSIQKDLLSLKKQPLHISENVGAFDFNRNPPQVQHDEDEVRLMVAHLKASLELVVNRIFTAAKEDGAGATTGGDEPLQIRWIEAYFPFTSPSFELEVFWQGEWLELLGCGIVKQSILNHAGLADRVGWAWGLGIERLAMVLFGIPDIRLFWSQDKRFLDQFKEGQIKKFEPFSKYPACYKDIAFWIKASPAAASPVGAESGSGSAAAAGGDATKASPADTQPTAFHENDVMEIVRDIGGNLVEDVTLVDEFVHPTTARKSLCYRINYRSLERTLTNDEINVLHSKVSSRLQKDLGVELR